MTDNILEIKGVAKLYEGHLAVNNVSLAIPRGQIFGLLGPNGAGKTTLIRMVTSITYPDSGSILFNGQNLHEAHTPLIGYMPEERGLYKKMKVGEQLLYLAQLRGMKPAEARKSIESWFERLDAKGWWNKKVEELSKGMAQKVQFVSTVMHSPQLLILDEPFSGLDPVNANLIKDEIYRLHSEGTTILFSTHRMEQVEEICDSIVLINKGMNILEGQVSEVKQRFKDNLFQVETDKEASDDLLFGVEVVSQKGCVYVVKLDSDGDTNKLLRRFMDTGLRIKSFSEILPSLNDIFIKKVGEVALV